MFLSRQFNLAICGLAVCASTANIAFAQRGGGGGGRGITARARFELATLPEVQADLKLNDEAKKLATELLAKQREKRAAAFGGGGGGGAGGGAAMQAEMAKMNAEFDAQLTAKLDATQNTRLNGLLAQVNGPSAMLDPEIAKSLKLSDEQLGKLKSVNDENRAARREAMTGFQDKSQEERTAAIAKLTEKENTALLAAVSEDLKKKFEELKGTALKIDQSPLRMPRPQ